MYANPFRRNIFLVGNSFKNKELDDITEEDDVERIRNPRGGRLRRHGGLGAREGGGSHEGEGGDGET